MINNRDREISSEFDLPTVSEILQHDEKGSDARDRGDHDIAEEHYNEAMKKTEEYLHSIEQIRKNEDLTLKQRQNLNEMENRLNLYQDMIKNQINRL